MNRNDSKQTREPRRARTYLKIDFDKKDHAKRHGAKWDAERKCWYVLREVPIELLNYVNEAATAMARSNESLDAAAQDSAAASSLRRPPDGDEQPDFFVPSLYYVVIKDSRSIMDVAVFRLSKKEKRRRSVPVR